ncbi:MTH1187 family thiamine-binding protein [Nannocystaceae bacterium ST9]
MHVIADICVIPTTGELSLSEPIARAHAILRDSGLAVSLHAWGTNVEGPIDQVLALIEQLHRELHADGIPRVATMIKLGTRIDKPQRMQDKLDSVAARLREDAT